MGNFTGAKCISCGKTFTDNDDVVVCPECGTPYHRECYLNEGKCINSELHESGQSWHRTVSETENGEDSGMVRCIRCGAENPSDKLFCEKCGTPLMKNDEAGEIPFNNSRPNPNMQNPNMQNPTGQPFGQNVGGQNPYGMPGQQMVFDKDSEIEGVKLDDYAKYVRTNPLPFLTNFIKFGKFGTRMSVNIGAFLFPEVYFLYRKMKKFGVLFFVLMAVLSVPSMIEYFESGIVTGAKISLGINITGSAFKGISMAAWYLSLVIRFVAGFFANYLYYRQAQKDIKAIRSSDDSGNEEEIKEKISVKGGTTWGAVVLGYVIFMLIVVGSIFGISKL